MTTEVQLSPKSKMLIQVSDELNALLQNQIDAMPSGFNQTRFLQNCLTVLNDTKEIEKCSPMSVARTMIKGAYLGLDFFRKECYAIPYGTELNFQTDYKGEIKLVKKYSQQPILDVYAQLVRQGDELDISIEAGKQVLNFKPELFNDKDIIGAFAVVYFADCSMRYEAMSKKEIEETRKNYSKAPNSPAWNKSWGEQAKKTVLRRLCKLLALDFDRAEQDLAFEEGAETEVRSGKKIIDTAVADPFKEAEKLNYAQETAIVDPDAELKATLKAKHPTEADWQIMARIKESRGEV